MAAFNSSGLTTAACSGDRAVPDLYVSVVLYCPRLGVLTLVSIGLNSVGPNTSVPANFFLFFFFRCAQVIPAGSSCPEIFGLTTPIPAICPVPASNSLR